MPPASLLIAKQFDMTLAHKATPPIGPLKVGLSHILGGRFQKFTLVTLTESQLLAKLKPGEFRFETGNQCLALGDACPIVAYHLHVQ